MKKLQDIGNDWAIADLPLIEEFRERGISARSPDVTDEILDKLWKPQEGPQTEAFYHQADELLYGGAAGGGKLQYAGIMGYRLQFLKDNGRYPEDSEIPIEIVNLETKVLTQTAWKNLSDLKVGDRIMNPDGTPQAVIKITEHNNKPLYRVTFEDNTSVLAGDEHLWGYWIARENSKGKSHRKNGGGVRTLTGIWNQDYIVRAKVGDTMEMKRCLDAGKSVITPICAPQRFARPRGKNKTMNPYLLGVLIGDGILGNPVFNKLRFCKSIEDEAIAERLRSEGFTVDLARTEPPTEKNGRTKDFGYWDVEDAESYEAMSSYGLLYKRSWEKFIPTYYLWASLEIREALAQGLMDTDGTVCPNGNHIEYSTTSKQLSKDAAHLFRSLGYMVRIHVKPAEEIINEDGSEGYHREAYRLMIQGHNTENLFSLPRKKERCKEFNAGVSWPGRRVKSIEYEMDGYARCIVVNNPNHLYVTDDFIVTHNSALLLILATLSHKRSVIFRREYPRLKDMIEKSRRLLNGVGRYNSTDKIWRGIPGDRTLEFGAVQYEEDTEKWRGVEHDLKAFDELGELSKEQYQFLITWNRSADPDVRCRVVATCNPPSNEESLWIIEYWAAWLDPNHPNPALPGEIRWYAMIDGEEVEVPSGDTIYHNNEEIMPRSRSFLPASLEDNSYLKNSNYKGVLQRLPEPLRSQLLYGDFTTKKTVDHPWQVIPSDWLDQAVARWSPNPPRPQSHIGVDVARGGTCESTIAPRHGMWIGQIIALPGSTTPDGDSLADEILRIKRSPNAQIRVDVVGVGSAVYDALNRRGCNEVFGLNGGGAAKDTEGKPYKDATGALEFFNLRSFWVWRIREYLDPARGFNLALPPDPKLRSDLLAPRWQIVNSRNAFGQIRVESKDDIIKRLKRSTDYGDAVMYAMAEFETDTGYDWMKNL